MSNINFDLFVGEIPKLIELLDEIVKIDPFSERHSKFYGITEYGIEIITEGYYSGETETNRTLVGFEELRQGIDYFRKRFDDEKRKGEEIERKYREEAQKAEENLERKKYEELKAKFG